MVALRAVCYNFIRIHKTLSVYARPRWNRASWIIYSRLRIWLESWTNGKLKSSQRKRKAIIYGDCPRAFHADHAGRQRSIFSVAAPRQLDDMAYIVRPSLTSDLASGSLGRKAWTSNGIFDVCRA